MSVSSLTPDHLSLSDQLCYVHCNFCDTILAVSVPLSSLFKSVTIRCGHCTNLLSVNMRGMLLPANNQLHVGPAGFFSPQNHLVKWKLGFSEEILDVPINQSVTNESGFPIRRGRSEIQNPPVSAKTTPEKRQRVPSAYNRFIKDEIQRIKAGDPEISHRQAFSAAAKNWAHFPHIYFGLTPDQPMKKPNICQQDEDVINKQGFFAPANVNVSQF